MQTPSNLRTVPFFATCFLHICLDTTDSLTQTEAYEERVARLEEARHWPMAGMVCVSPMH